MCDQCNYREMLTRAGLAVTDNRLSIIPVTILWKDVDTLFVKNDIDPGSAIVVSELSAPVQGMALRINTP